MTLTYKNIDSLLYIADGTYPESDKYYIIADETDAIQYQLNDDDTVFVQDTEIHVIVLSEYPKCFIFLKQPYETPEIAISRFEQSKLSSMSYKDYKELIVASFNTLNINNNLTSFYFSSNIAEYEIKQLLDSTNIVDLEKLQKHRIVKRGDSIYFVDYVGCRTLGSNYPFVTQPFWLGISISRQRTKKYVQRNNYYYGYEHPHKTDDQFCFGGFRHLIDEILYGRKPFSSLYYITQTAPSTYAPSDVLTNFESAVSEHSYCVCCDNSFSRSNLYALRSGDLICSECSIICSICDYAEYEDECYSEECENCGESLSVCRHCHEIGENHLCDSCYSEVHG